MRHAILIIGLILSAAVRTSAAPLDRITLALGVDDHANETVMYHASAQKLWGPKWFAGGDFFVRGMWDANVAYLHSGIQDRANHRILDIGIAPILKLSRHSNSAGASPYFEMGIGPHLLSETTIGRLNLSTTFQFGSVFGVGWQFGSEHGFEIGYRFQHLSNAKIVLPNDGINLHQIRVGWGI